MEIGSGIMLRGKGSNLRPSGYEPDELPLLYLAMFGVQSYANITSKTSLLMNKVVKFVLLEFINITTILLLQSI